MTNIAPLKLRIISGFLDLLIYSLFYQQIVLILVTSSTFSGFLTNLLLLLFFFIIIFPLLIPLISILFVCTWGATPGKLITGLEIIDEKGAKISIRSAFFRNYAGYLISSSLFFLGFIWIYLDKKRRGWHDLISGTYVVVVEKAGMLTGIIAIIATLMVNIYFTCEIFSQIRRNERLYFEIISSFKSEMDKMPDTQYTEPSNYTLRYK